MLFDVRRDRLARMLLPVGDLPKSVVRDRARELGLATADKPDSQEICFVAPGEHAALVARRLGGSRAGDVVDAAGSVLGRHDGIEHFTVGQRRRPALAVVEPLGAGRFAARFTGGPDASPGPISPGQPAVCYRGDRLLGGGWIEG